VTGVRSFLIVITRVLRNYQKLVQGKTYTLSQNEEIDKSKVQIN